MMIERLADLVEASPDLDLLRLDLSRSDELGDFLVPSKDDQI
jgi:hypothetical protein